MTTVIIDREKGTISTDSRGTITNKIKVKGSLFKQKEEKEYLDNTTKIFKVDNTIICGCGSLCLLKHIVTLFTEDCIILPKYSIMHSKYDLSETNVYITKRTLSKCYTIRLELKATKILGLNYQIVKLRKYLIEVSHTFAGSGWEFAAGAYNVKKDPIEAITIASKFDDYTGGYIQQVNI